MNREVIEITSQSSFEMKDDDLATKELPNVDSLLENDQNKPDSQVSQPKTYSELEIVDPTLPLSDLVIYVEIFTNGSNISETTYKYLEQLGAKIEKRVFKLSNLVIWKDGNMRTLERAKQNSIRVVNSLWLEECIEKYCKADYDKYPPMVAIRKEEMISMTTLRTGRKKGSAKRYASAGEFHKDTKHMIFTKPTDNLRKKIKTATEEDPTSYKHKEVVMNFNKMESYSDYLKQNSSSQNVDDVAEQNETNTGILKEFIKSEFSELAAEPQQDSYDISLPVLFPNEQDEEEKTEQKSQEDTQHYALKSPSIVLINDKNSFQKDAEKSKSPETDEESKYSSAKATQTPYEYNTTSVQRKVVKVDMEIALSSKPIEVTEQMKKTPITKNPVFFREFSIMKKLNKQSLMPIESNQYKSLGESHSSQSSIRQRQKIIIETPEELKNPIEEDSSTFVEEKQIQTSNTESLSNRPDLMCVLYTNLAKLDVEKLKALEYRFPQNIQVAEDNLKGVYECDAIIIDGKENLPKTAKTALSIILGKRLIKKSWIEASLNQDKLQDPQDFQIIIKHQKLQGLLSGKVYFIDEDFDREPFLNLLSHSQVAVIITKLGGKLRDILPEANFAILKTTTKRKLNTLPFHVKPMFYQALIDLIIDKVSEA